MQLRTPGTTVVSHNVEAWTTAPDVLRRVVSIVSNRRAHSLENTRLRFA